MHNRIRAWSKLQGVAVRSSAPHVMRNTTHCSPSHTPRSQRPLPTIHTTFSSAYAHRPPTAAHHKLHGLLLTILSPALHSNAFLNSCTPQRITMLAGGFTRGGLLHHMNIRRCWRAVRGRGRSWASEGPCGRGGPPPQVKRCEPILARTLRAETKATTVSFELQVFHTFPTQTDR